MTKNWREQTNVRYFVISEFSQNYFCHNSISNITTFTNTDMDRQRPEGKRKNAKSLSKLNYSRFKVFNTLR